MRADTLVTFVKEGKDQFDPTTGNYISEPSVSTEIYCLVTDTGDERMNLLYGGIKQRAKTVRLNAQYNELVDYLIIDGESYQIDRKRAYRHKMTYEVSGV
jgi:hypothetical protein